MFAPPHSLEVEFNSCLVDLMSMHETSAFLLRVVCLQARGALILLYLGQGDRKCATVELRAVLYGIGGFLFGRAAPITADRAEHDSREKIR